MTAEQVIDAWVVPAGVAEFHRMAIRLRQRLQELFEAFEIERPLWGQLIQGPDLETCPERLDPVEQSRDRLIGVLQLLHVREETAGLDRIHEMLRCLFGPAGERRFFWKAVEGVVDFDRIKAHRIVSKPEGLREIGRIKVAPPVLVLPA